MHWFITGASGFVGQALVDAIIERGDRVTGLTRAVAKSHNPNVTWIQDLEQLPSDADVIVNLAGEGIADRRWTPGRKRALRDSRIALTERLVERARALGIKRMISGSAVGYYGVGGQMDEGSPVGSGFAAQLCSDWEQAASEFDGDLALLRIGVVLGNGGFLNRTYWPFFFGLGGPIGSGKQGFSWVHLNDLVAMILWVADGNRTGVYNACGPEAATNASMTLALGRAVHRPAFLPAPGAALRLVFGEMADELLLSGQQALPARALDEGFVFEHSTLASAMQAAVASKRSGSTGG